MIKFRLFGCEISYKRNGTKNYDRILSRDMVAKKKGTKNFRSQFGLQRNGAESASQKLVNLFIYF